MPQRASSDRPLAVMFGSIPVGHAAPLPSILVTEPAALGIHVLCEAEAPGLSFPAGVPLDIDPAVGPLLG